MLIILDETRHRRRPSATVPRIREVCLAGHPSRRYRHLTLEDGPGTRDSGSSPGLRPAAGVRESGGG